MQLHRFQGSAIQYAREKQPFVDVIQIGVLKNSATFTGKH